jgi:hypothetical protein
MARPGTIRRGVSGYDRAGLVHMVLPVFGNRGWLFQFVRSENGEGKGGG